MVVVGRRLLAVQGQDADDPVFDDQRDGDRRAQPRRLGIVAQRPVQIAPAQLVDLQRPLLLRDARAEAGIQRQVLGLRRLPTLSPVDRPQP